MLVAVLNIGPMHVIVRMLPFDHHRSFIGSGTATAREHNGGTEHEPSIHGKSLSLAGSSQQPVSRLFEIRSQLCSGGSAFEPVRLRLSMSGRQVPPRVTFGMARSERRRRGVGYRLAASGILLLVGIGTPVSAAPPAAPAEGINSKFLDPTLDPQEWVERFEVESREVFHAREAILDALSLKPGDRIADVGSGTGAFLTMFSRAVGPAGRVYAVDISPRLIQFVEKRVREEKLDNVAVVHSTATSTRLLPGSVGTVFTCDTYHHFEQYPEMLASIHQALVPGGLFVVVDFERIEGVSREWIMGHVRAGKETVRQEIEAAGFEFLDEVEVPAFAENYLLRFRRPVGSAAQ